ncbi:hypothetical protein N7925_24145 [Streptomyces sp. CA-278952]|uniref:hypothetical protein n=1 Tax=Streptomyces sp. CA-278952 TaxID=2980556 RepID=UPI00236897AC|nr:hypothetical protein [Streptomyces sp. CA-278952]WDG31197.1 hypothetical protein N7925_24145 [Streptomyces sp. CA-278952]
MKPSLARLLEPALSFLIPAPRKPHSVEPYLYPYSCAYVGGPTVYRTSERPPRGEDSPLVRPYFVAHERRAAEERAAGARRRRKRSGALLIAARDVHLGRVGGVVA